MIRNKKIIQMRGVLKPLLSEEEKQKADIQALSYDYACRITRLFQYLTEESEYKEFIQSKQLYRSGTSIGANVREANHAQSDADFLNKMNLPKSQTEKRGPHEMLWVDIRIQHAQGHGKQSDERQQA